MSTRNNSTQAFEDVTIRLPYNSSRKAVKAITTSLGASAPFL